MAAVEAVVLDIDNLEKKRQHLSPDDVSNPHDSLLLRFMNMDLLHALFLFLDPAGRGALSAANWTTRMRLPVQCYRTLLRRWASHYTPNVDWGHLCIIFPDPLLGAPLAVCGTYNWKDQGWGNRKGWLQLRLFRCVQEQNKEPTRMCVATESISGLAEHHMVAHSFSLNVSNSKLLQACRTGDQLEVWRHIGGGGGHSLEVSNLRVVVSLRRKRGGYSGTAEHGDAK